MIYQLLKIYYSEEFWHKTKMPYDEAYDYHKKRLEDGRIYIIVKDGKVLGYYEREINGDTCFLKNVFVIKEYRFNGVFKELYKHFFLTMSKNIKYVIGEKQSVGGKMQRVLTGGRNGNNEN